LLVAVVGVFYIANSGLVPWLFGERHRAAQERDQLIEHYAKEADNVRRWREQDAERYEARIAELDKRIASLIEAAVLSERGNARLRHLVGNLFQHIAAQRAAERRRGHAPLPYDGWRDALNISPDLDDRLKALFEETDFPPSPTVC
jgi:hypothetical protein